MINSSNAVRAAVLKACAWLIRLMVWPMLCGALILASGCETPVPLYPTKRAPITGPSQSIKRESPAAAPTVSAGGVPATAQAPTTAQAYPLPIEPLPAAIAADAPIALLLPTQSPDFTRAAEAFKAGVTAAQTVLAPKQKIIVIDTDDSRASVLAGYQMAVDAGAAVIIGPLTRTAVQTVVSEARITVPTLLLNTTESPTPANALTFALNVESEARQIARRAYVDATQRVVGGMPSAVVLTGPSALDKRTGQALVDGFLEAGGMIAHNYEATNEATISAINNARPTVVLLALDGPQAARVYAFLREFPAYGGSALNSRPERIVLQELEGVRFVEMPWMLRRNDPALAVYARPDNAARYSVDLERLYAFGIDAFQVALQWRQGQSSFSIEGVTGSLMKVGSMIDRRGLIGVFRDGQAIEDSPP